jgi:histidinol-phosphate aminotransferase
MSRLSLNEHGGPDSGPAVAHDFSSNANPLAAPEAVLEAIGQADRHRYPDPHYQALRDDLAAVLNVAPRRLLPTAGSSEAIRRLTLMASLQGVKQVWVPQPGYGDYAAAAQALGLTVHGYASGADLLDSLAARTKGPALAWLCEPCNPTGQSLPAAFWLDLADLMAQDLAIAVALDRAYEPLRLVGADPVPQALAAQCWQLCSPNKALGLTGVRAGYVVAPIDGDGDRGPDALSALAPSWVLSAEGVAFLRAWHRPDTQAWLARSRLTLAQWMHTQQAGLHEWGWHGEPSVVPFQLARPPQDASHLLNELRAQGIKLRDARSFGLPGWVRLSAQPPAAQQALFKALQQITRKTA